jgi:hypothetical protein
MTLDEADEKIHLMNAEPGPSSVFIGVRRDPRPLRRSIEPTRVTATVLIAIGRNDDRITRL